MTEAAVVTGGLGRSGRWICDRLADEYRVVCVDLDHPGWEASERDRIDFRAADVTDGAEVRDLVSELTPERHAGSRVFETNVEATYTVLDTAGRADAEDEPTADPGSGRLRDRLARFSIFRGGAPGLKKRGLPTGRKHEASRPGRKPT